MTTVSNNPTFWGLLPVSDGTTLSFDSQDDRVWITVWRDDEAGERQAMAAFSLTADEATTFTNRVLAEAVCVGA